jgi:hypothetical protein
MKLFITQFSPASPHIISLFSDTTNVLKHTMYPEPVIIRASISSDPGYRIA